MTKIIGHRGAAGLALENSPESVKAALALPLDGIEFDIHQTQDGQLVTIHDKHTGRVAKKKLWIADSTLAELQRIKLKNGQHIMTLDETLMLVGTKKPVVLDIKVPGVRDELLRVLARHPKASVIISSRKYAELEAIHKVRPDLPLLAQSHLSPTDVIHAAHHIGAIGVSINKWLISPYVYHLAERAGLEIRVYTVNQPWLMTLLTKLYPNITIYTDHPGRFIGKDNS